MCKHILVIDKTKQDSESVVGDECHIVSGAKSGPRYDPTYSEREIDSLTNLMILCKIHHKVVDDQEETYTANELRKIKDDHEKWVEEKLQEHPQFYPLRIRRIKNEIPKQLPLVRSGQTLLNLAIGCHGAYHDYSENLDEEEIELVGGFLQNLSDWSDIGAGLEPIELIRASKSIDDQIKNLNSRGFLVFAFKERQRLEGGVDPPSAFYVLHVSVRRENDPGVIRSQNES